jgi:hypothetical protein
MRNTNGIFLYSLLLISILVSCYIFITDAFGEGVVSDININNNQSYHKNNSDFGMIVGIIEFIGMDCPPISKKEVPPCSGPFPNLPIIAYTDDNEKKIAATTKTDSNGNYQIILKPGNYLIYASLESPSRLDIAKANIYEHITILRNEKITKNFDIDTKIR